MILAMDALDHGESEFDEEAEDELDLFGAGADSEVRALSECLDEEAGVAGRGSARGRVQARRPAIVPA